MALASRLTLAGSFHPGLFVLANSIVILDLFDLLLRVHIRRDHTRGTRGEPAPTSVRLNIGSFTPYQVRLHVEPYALLVSVHNAEEELEDFLGSLRLFQNHLWVIDDASTDNTWFQLQRARVRCIHTSTNLKKPGAIKELLSHLPREIATVVILDPDARIRKEETESLAQFERVVFEFQRSGMAALCPRLAVSEDGWLPRLQALEYSMAFSLGRKSLSDHCVTSGIAIYRRDALEKLLQSHTLSVYAEDLKNAFILMGRGEKIYYDGRLVIDTAGKRTWREWFSQRVGWFYGLIKVYQEHFAEVRRGTQKRPFFVYQYLIYMGGFTVLLHPLKLASLGLLILGMANGLDYLLDLEWIPDVGLTEPAYFLFAYVQYTCVAVAAIFFTEERQERPRLLVAAPAYFLYALAQLVPITVGYLNWLAVRLRGQRLYRDHYA